MNLSAKFRIRMSLQALLGLLVLEPAGAEPPLIPGAEPFYFQGDNGAAVLLIHGFTSSPREMRELGETLAREGYTVSSILLPGHGTSPEDLSERSSEEWYSKVEEECRRLQAGHRRVYAAGFSLGGLLALRLAQEEELSGVAALAPALAITYRWYYVLTPEAHARTLGRLLPYVRKSPRWTKVRDRTQIPGHIAYRRIPSSAIRELLALSGVVREAADRIEEPLLIVQPRHDGVSSPGETRSFFLRAGAREKRFVWLERSDHLLTLDYEKAAVFREVLRFFEKQELLAGLGLGARSPGRLIARERRAAPALPRRPARAAGFPGGSRAQGGVQSRGDVFEPERF